MKNNHLRKRKMTARKALNPKNRLAKSETTKRRHRKGTTSRLNWMRT